MGGGGGASDCCNIFSMRADLFTFAAWSCNQQMYPHYFLPYIFLQDTIFIQKHI